MSAVWINDIDSSFLSGDASFKYDAGSVHVFPVKTPCALDYLPIATIFFIPSTENPSVE